MMEAARGATGGAVVDGRFRIERKVGQGGMSVVFEATDLTTGERRALKLLAPALSRDAAAMARLRDEARLAARLSHPNVCPILHVGTTEDGFGYLVMPFLDGERLADRRNRLGVIPLVETVAIVRQLAAGLRAAHDLKIIHRDVKPENVMLCRDPHGGERAVLMDFGLARDRDGGDDPAVSGEEPRLVAGTPEFMSPEQVRGRRLDTRSDIYALALVTYEMLAGRLPFAGRTQSRTMSARLAADAVPIRHARPDLQIPVAVERVLSRALERSRQHRFPTVTGFADALAEAARGEGRGGRGEGPRD